MLISDFDYPLPDERIARFPPAERDASRLLVWRGGGERGEPGYAEISKTVFSDIARELPPDSTLVFNDTRVVRARLAMFRPSGARIEILCLEPHEPADYERAFAARGVPADGSGGGCEWRAMIGNAKKWKSGPVEIRGEEGELLLRAWRKQNLSSERAGCKACEASGEGAYTDVRDRAASEHNAADGALSRQIVRFEWPGDETFGQKLEQLGRVPIPPYLDRDTQPIDSQRYQTVYASIEGSVAAPTAGLHFTSELIDRITRPHTGRGASEQLSRQIERVTLHVGAGTFLPVKSADALEHPMHSEHFEVSLGTVERLAERLRAGGRIVAVGTTSVRTLESLAVLSWRLRSHTGRGEARAGFCARLLRLMRFARPSRRPKRSGRTSFAKKFSKSDFPSALSATGLASGLPKTHQPSAATREQSLAPEPLTVDQFAWREVPEGFGGAEALENLAAWMRERGLETLRGETRIMITPGYKFRVVGGLVTNFHQPKSTLLLLVSAFTGGRWREIYDYALAHDFRFLSYGDSSLLLP